MYHVVHNTCIAHGRNIKTRYFGLILILQLHHPSKNTSSLFYSKSCLFEDCPGRASGVSPRGLFTPLLPFKPLSLETSSSFKPRKTAGPTLRGTVMSRTLQEGPNVCCGLAVSPGKPPLSTALYPRSPSTRGRLECQGRVLARRHSP